MARTLHLYVHVPFCARKCPYCAFYNLRYDDARETLYLDALARELAGCRERGAFEDARLGTLYWGGGTPSMLSDGAFERLADLCLGVAPMAQELEWTIETNPDDAESDRFARWRDRGVTRVSIGAQSFDDRRLRFLGRNHDATRARAAIENAAQASFEDISIDLIFNLAWPSDAIERRRAWARDVTLAFALPVTHVSLYGLTLEPGTAFDARARAGERLDMADSAAATEYRAASRVAERAGFEHYEVSSFARHDAASGITHRARHNAAYWTGAPYLGVGPSAHSFDGVRRWANVASLVAWAEALSTGGDPRAFVEMLTPSQRNLETLYLGLRTREGVPANHPHVRDAPLVVQALCAEGYLAKNGGRLACTERGFIVLDALLERLAIDGSGITP